MFSSFLNSLALPYANNTRFKMIHITSFNEWHEDTEIEPSVVTVPTTTDTSPTGMQYTQGLVYQGFGTTYLDILRNEISAAQSGAAGSARRSRLADVGRRRLTSAANSSSK